MEKMNYQVAPEFAHLEEWLCRLPEFFACEGERFFKNRNEIRVFETNGIVINVKEFKIPNWFNRFSYVYLRGSKAKRSYQYARRFGILGVPTPTAVGFVNCIKYGLLAKSYYASVHLRFDYTLKAVRGFEPKLRDEIFRKWVRFTSDKLHRNGIFHLDYSQGNTLITVGGNEYHFSIVDLNRMEFGPVSFHKGLTNFCQLGLDDAMLKIVSDEYAQIHGRDSAEACQYILDYSHKSAARRQKKEDTKAFWRKLFKFGRVEG